MGSATAHEKIQVCPLMGLLYVLNIQPLPTSRGKGRWRPPRAACRECVVIDVQPKVPLVYIESDHISRLDKSEWAAGSRFRRSM
jgi:hypothetical protein